MKILATGSYLPEVIWTNDDLRKKVETTDEWIVERTGIQARHIALKETTATMAHQAAIKALHQDHEVSSRDVELIVVATSTPDDFLPSVANEVLKDLGINKAMAMDVNAACSGFTHALDVASSLMVMHKMTYALVIGAESMSKIIDWKDRNTCVLFGDGAGAVLLENDDGCPFLYQKCASIPDRENALTTGRIVNEHLLSGPLLGSRYLKMKGTDVFKFAVKTVHDEIVKSLKKTKLTFDEIDYVVLHQANSRISDYVAKKMGVSNEKFYSNIATVGNTSAASIPIVLDEMNTLALLERGMKLMLVGFGAGLSYGTVMLEW